jgi:hypothetical protein
MSEMVQRVAKAIRDATVIDCGESGSISMTEEKGIEVARVAIAAMREPAESMIGGPWPSVSHDGECKKLPVWQAMIDEALK